MSTPLPEHITRPEFAVAVRGYDRNQVDAYFGRVLEWLADAENRATGAERAREVVAREASDLRATVTLLEERAGMPAPQSMSAFSERMSQVMQSAMEAAQELRDEAEREARRLRDEVAAETGQLLERAKSEAERIVEESREAQLAMEASIAELRETRKEAVDELLALQQRIAEVAGQPEPSREGLILDGADGPATRAVDTLGLDPTGFPEGQDGDETMMVDAIGTDTVDALIGGVGGADGVYVTAAPTTVLPAVEGSDTSAASDAADGADGADGASDGAGRRPTERVQRVGGGSRKRRAS